MKPEFQMSYTLDILFYIGSMIDEKKRKLYNEDVDRFMPMLGTISDKYLERLKKINQGTPDFISHIVSMLIVNDHLHDWTTADLLDKHKRLATMFKREPQFKHAPKPLKKFISQDFSKSMSLIKTIADDLERLAFKNFWLEEKLPLLKERIAEFQSVTSEFDIIAHVNDWVKDKKIPKNGLWYMLAYSGNQYQLLLHEFNVVSVLISADQIFDRVVSYALKNTSYRSLCKGLKPTSTLKEEFKGHEKYKLFKGISGYADTCLRLALKVYLMEKCSKTGLSLPGDYPFAAEMIAYLREHEKPVGLAVGNYVAEMMKHFSRK